MTGVPTPPAQALAGRVILVTGAYGGLGEAAAKACAQAGATVVLLGRKVPKLNRVYDAIKTIGPEPALYPLDMAGADPADYEAMADKIGADLGSLDGLLHCAVEFTGLRPLQATPPADFLRHLHVNITAPWLLTQACLPWLGKSADSAVVFVSDDLARVNRAYWGAYGVAKAGLVGMMRMLHDETDHGPVRVSALEPGPMRTAIRNRAFVEEAATRCPPASAYAPACVHLLSAAGSDQRGQVFAPRADWAPSA
ncbi:MAG TPA: SDR family NAD(P)-dependent oxidoreductase [Arenimonas sp.]|uniref:SDR family NAD(P)-dependent oxidoreductase n=1 Tax=Arenimonas sp. TaxID=1872635 RepID=UPI002B9D7F48|nr:SDR family NAD(P)-dependent oxidoreductase [Arenimonas sp.]HMB57213.1 SDR family NAD(P)-dependent oxidoreductase [Arenimonas sp.]